jgi:hypothetical protein
MTSFRQIDANRRNARKSTGPTTEEGKQRSRCNAIHWSQRHLVGKSLLVERNWVRFVQTGFGQRQPI